jgi:integrase
MNLRWQHISFFEEKGKRYLALKVNGKTGEREVIARHNIVRYLGRLRLLSTNDKHKQGTSEDFLKRKHKDYVFRVDEKNMTTSKGKMFARLLTNMNLLHDAKTGRERTIYSLRHYYAIIALTYNRLTVYTLAKHMETSVTMIEQYYAHILLRKLAHDIAGGYD